jgi:hypothetical protein
MKKSEFKSLIKECMQESFSAGGEALLVRVADALDEYNAKKNLKKLLAELKAVVKKSGL